MDAKELRDKFDPLDSGLIYAERETILRALDLLAATEGSTDEIVRALRDEADLCRNETATDIADLLDEAASCIVAMASQFKAKDAALVAMKAAKEKAEAERDELKRHAEAMAEELQWIACRYDDSKSTRECAADAYEMKSAAAQALHAYRAAQEKP